MTGNGENQQLKAIAKELHDARMDGEYKTVVRILISLASLKREEVKPFMKYLDEYEVAYGV